MHDLTVGMFSCVPCCPLVPAKQPHFTVWEFKSTENFSAWSFSTLSLSIQQQSGELPREDVPPQRTCTRLIRQHPQITLLQADFLLNVSFTGVIGILTAPSSSCAVGLNIPKVAMFTGKVVKRLSYLEDSDIKHLLFQLRSHLSGLLGGGGNSYQEVEPSYK